MELFHTLIVQFKHTVLSVWEFKKNVYVTYSLLNVSKLFKI